MADDLPRAAQVFRVARHRHYKSSDHVWQGRFKAFPIQDDHHLLTVIGYVERNPVRAKTIPVRKAKNWPWGSAATPPRLATEAEAPLRLDPGPVRRPPKWADWVDQPQSEVEVAAIDESLTRGAPLGGKDWREATAKKLGLESTMRPRGRPNKAAD